MSKNVIQKSLLLEKFRERDLALEMNESTIKRRCSNLSYLLRYVEKYSIEEYSSKVGYDFLESFITNEPTSTYVIKQMKLIVSIANNICDGIPYNSSRERTQHLMFGSMSTVAENYIKHATEVSRLSVSTIARYRYIISLFTQKMYLENISWDTLKYKHVLDFLSLRINTDARVYTSVRNLLHFAFLNKCTSEDLSLLFQSIKPYRCEKLPSFYTPAEIDSVEKSVDRRSTIGKRDYAIILLPSHFSLISDFCSSGQTFAASFLLIPHRYGHHCSWLYASHY